MWDNIADMICKQIYDGSTVHLARMQYISSNERLAVTGKLTVALSARDLSVELNLMPGTCLRDLIGL